MNGEKRRALPGNTHDPFDCCGAEAGPYGRPKGKICRDCQALIDEGKAARKRLDPGLIPYKWTEVNYGWPRFYGSGAQLPGETGDDLSKAFWRLANLVTEPAPADVPMTQEVPNDRGGTTWRDWPTLVSTGQRPLSHDEWSWKSVVLSKPSVQAALDGLYKAIRAALGATYAEGRRRGGNALLGLAAGDVSLTDFETFVEGKERGGL